MKVIHGVANAALAAKCAALAVLVVFPLFVDNPYFRHLMIVAMIYAVVASNWDLSLGYAGVFNFAHVAFFAIGAYAAGVAMKTFGVSAWYGLPIGGAAAIVGSLLICLPVLRLKGIYVVLVTFAFGQLCLQIVLSQTGYTGGSMGLVAIPQLHIGDYSFARDGKIAYYYAAVLILVFSTVYLRRLVGSDFGRSIVALRDDEAYAISRGVSLARQRLLTFAASAAFTGIAGAFYGQYLRVVSPDLFGFSFLALALSMLLVGGINTIYGPMVGAFLLTFVAEFMVDLGPWRFLFIATMMVGILLLYPAGLLAALEQGGRQAGTLARRWVERRPG